MQEIRSLAEAGNKYFDEKAPWKTLASDPVATKKVLTTTLNLFRIIAIYLKPVIPSFAAKVEKLFQEDSYKWSDSLKVLKNHKISNYEMLAVRIEPTTGKSILEATKAKTAALAANAAAGANALIGTNANAGKVASAKASAATTTAPVGHSGGGSSKPTTDTTDSGIISIDDFNKIDLRIAKIIEAEPVKEADKLLKLKVDLGPLGTRQIFAGIKSAYAAENLVGRLTVVVANLAPRKMKFGMSEGMVLAAGAGGKDLFIMSPDEGAQPGDRVK
jgi:methionyl-tRNA synthetase